MTDQLREYFQNTDNCKRDICKARQIFGNITTTEAEYDAMEKTLGLMYLHCPEDLQMIVFATLEEAETRRFFHQQRWTAEAVTSFGADA